MWMMGNIYTRTNSIGNIKPDKEKSTEKIDGAVAAIMALGRVIRCGNVSAESVYDARGCCFCNKNAEKQLFTASPETSIYSNTVKK